MPDGQFLSRLKSRVSLLRNNESLIDTGLQFADRMLILVGSAQEIGTLRNPFDVATRINLIKEIYPDDNVIVKPLPDMTHENDINSDWGRYLLRHVDQYVYKLPELMIYGNDEARSKWFSPEDIMGCMEVIVSREQLKICATDLRNLLVDDNIKEWQKWVNPKLHKHYPMLRQQLVMLDAYKNRKGE